MSVLSNVHSLTEQVDNTGGYNSMLSTCVNTCFAQQESLYKGIKEYGECVIAAMTKELLQLNKGAVQDKPVIRAISYDTKSSKCS